MTKQQGRNRVFLDQLNTMDRTAKNTKVKFLSMIVHVINNGKGHWKYVSRGQKAPT